MRVGHRRAVTRFVRRWRVEWAVLSVASYAVMFPVTFLVFPDNSLWLALMVLWSGFTSATAALGALLAD